MAVYVDDMYRHPIGRFGRLKMSRMVADSTAELLHMADKIGVPRRWLQRPDRGRGRKHFDLSMSARRKAVATGALELTMGQMAGLCQRWRTEREI